jgi:hypothetical protein
MPMLKALYQLLVEKIVVNDRRHIYPTFRVPFVVPAVRNVNRLVERMPPDPNFGSPASGRTIRLATQRKRRNPNCRNEVIVALRVLVARHGDRPFLAREVYAQMVTAGTAYEELTAYKAMQRMKRADPRLPGIYLERTGRDGFRLVEPLD